MTFTIAVADLRGTTLISLSNNFELYLYLCLTFVLALMGTLWLVPRNINLGLNLGLVDKPNSRKRHDKNKVRIGGLSIILGFFIAIFSSY